MMGVMTVKRDGLLALLLLSLAACAAAGYYFFGDWQPRGVAAPKPLPTLADVQVPADTVLDEMDALRKHLNRLAYPRAAGRTGVPLTLFGYTPAAAGVRQGVRVASGEAAPIAQFDYLLSFALSSGKRKLCIIDEHLFTQGASLPDGGRILTIEPERVLIEKKPLRRWIYLQEPPPDRVSPREARVPGQTRQGVGQTTPKEG